MNTAIIIIQLLLGALGTFTLFYLKGIKEDVKELKGELKSDIKSIDDKIGDIRDRLGRVEGQEDFSRSAILELWKREKKGGDSND